MSADGRRVVKTTQTLIKQRDMYKQTRTAVEGEVSKYRNTRKTEKWSKKYY